MNNNKGFRRAAVAVRRNGFDARRIVRSRAFSSFRRAGANFRRAGASVIDYFVSDITTAVKAASNEPRFVFTLCAVAFILLTHTATQGFILMKLKEKLSETNFKIVSTYSTQGLSLSAFLPVLIYRKRFDFIYLFPLAIWVHVFSVGLYQAIAQACILFLYTRTNRRTTRVAIIALAVAYVAFFHAKLGTLTHKVYLDLS